MWEWFSSNMEWIFSGIGVAIFGVFIRALFMRKDTKKSKTIYRQENNKHSHGVQIGNQYNYGGKDSERY